MHTAIYRFALHQCLHLIDKPLYCNYLIHCTISKITDEFSVWSDKSFKLANSPTAGHSKPTDHLPSHGHRRERRRNRTCDEFQKMSRKSSFDQKWFARYAVGKIIVETLADMEPEFPKLSEAQRAQLDRYRKIREVRSQKCFSFLLITCSSHRTSFCWGSLRIGQLSMRQ